MPSRKWAITRPGASLYSTTRAPRTDLGQQPDAPARPRARSGRGAGGSADGAPPRVPIAATVTRALISRLPNSTQAWNCRGATTSDAVQSGQSGQPRPGPVRRTAAPEMIVSTSAHTAAAAISRNVRGETRQARQSRQSRRRAPGRRAPPAPPC